MSKQELELPQGWVEAKLGDLANYINGRPFKPKEWEEKGRPIIRIQNLTKTNSKSNRFSGNVDEKNLIRDGDMMISWSATLGCFFHKGEESILNQHIFKVEPYIEKQFLFHLVMHILSELKQKTHGSGMQHITKGKFDSHQLIIPPLNEQKRIASKIEELFSKIDSAKQSLEHTKLQLEQYRYSLLNYVLDNRNSGNKQNYNLFPISDVVDSISQGWSPKCERIASLNEKEWSVITTTAIQPMKFNDYENKRLPPNLEPRPQLELNENDLLMTRAGPRSRVGITCLIKKTRKRLLLCDKAYRIKFKQNLISGSFFEILLNSGEFLEKINEIKTGTSDSGLNLTMKRFSDLIITLPSLNQQEQIVLQIEQGFSLIENTTQIVESSLQQLQTMKMSVLKQAFEGKLVPQDPNDEPASVLLERIKSTKESQSTKQRRTKNVK